MTNNLCEGKHFKKELDFLIMLLGIDTSDKREIHLIGRVVVEAEQTVYTPNPKTKLEELNNEIFALRGKMFYYAHTHKNKNDLQDRLRMKHFFQNRINYLSHQIKAYTP